MKTVSLISTSARVSNVLAAVLVLSLASAGIARAEDKAAAPAAAAAPASAAASVAAGAKIAVVDLSYLVAESKAGKSIRSQIDSQRKAYGVQIKKKEDDFNKEGASLKEQQGKLSKEEFAKKYKAYIEKAKKAEEEVHNRRESFEKAYVTALEKLREEVVKIVAGISSKNNINLVLNRQEVVLVDAKMDITKDVLSQLDAKVTSIPVNIK